MPVYMYEAAYTAESIAAQIKDPKDRVEVVRPLFDAVGARILASGYPFGQHDVLVVYEAADDTVAAAIAMAVAGGGATRSARTTKLLTGEEWVASLRRAGEAAPQYRPAR